jgi:surface antigen
MAMSNSRKSTAVALLLVAAAWSVSTLADPPRHAPAHGWRRHHDQDYVGYTGEHWDNDYEISSGRCNRQAIATAVGGVVGGVIASQVAKPENRVVATLIGAAAGALIGHKVGHELDEADRGCFGHALEIGRSGQRVVWTNETTRVRYELSPGRDRRRNGAACREFTLVTFAGGRSSSQVGLACRSQVGAWEVVQ